MDAAAWIVATLKADTALSNLIGSRIYRDVAPEGTAYPFIAFQCISSKPVQNAFADRLMDGELWQIKAVDKSSGSYSTVNAISVRIEAVLHKKRGSNVLSSVLEFKMPRTETDPTGTYKSMILDFRVHTQ